MASIRVGIVSAALALVPAIAVAQAKLDARYVVTLGGVRRRPIHSCRQWRDHRTFEIVRLRARHQ
jgi:hypothetical protein